MKNLTTFFALAMVILQTACKEEPPGIVFNNPSDFDTTYVIGSPAAAQVKTILIEDFTGVRCKNCPSAHEEVADMILQNPGRIVALSLHPSNNSLAVPLSTDTALDFRLADAQQLSDNFGGFFGLPAGGIDRVKYSGQTYTYSSNYTIWAGFIPERINLKTPYNLDISNSYNAVNNELTTIVTVTVTKETTDTLLLTTLLAEKGVIGPQELPNGTVKDDYEHNHLARMFITAPSGKQLTGKHEIGRVYYARTVRKLKSYWNPAKCSVVAIVHSGGASREVYHAAEKSIR